MKIDKNLLTHMKYIQIVLMSLLSLNAFALSNALQDSPSPYLRMHKSDPVQWQTWGEDVLKQAQQENKLIYVSIGYFSCHWCHVMQKESYSNQEIGDVLNENFIPVKVDRELRPELDRRLIQFVESISGRAGWPLNVFITPDGYPITGFTYLPKKDFESVLTALALRWTTEHEKLGKAAQSYFEHSEKSEKKSALVALPDKHYEKVVDGFVAQAMLIGDDLQGGFGESNKFPSYPQLNALLKIIKLKPDLDTDVSAFFRLTLEAMATKNLMDHVNYGFYRYVTDPDWQTPHFEKMLYDNAQLASLYFDAEKQWPNQGYAQIGLNTLDFMQQFMANGEGGFFASLSAVDVNNIEGGAYYWDAKELKEALSVTQYSVLKKDWGFSDSDTDLQIKPLRGIGADASKAVFLQTLQQQLRNVTKDKMPVDTKSLASWNALALKAFVKANEYQSTADLKLQMHQLYNYMRANFIKNNQAVKFAGLDSAAETTLEDYAQLAHAFNLYGEFNNHQGAKDLSKQLVSDAFALYFDGQHWRQNTKSLIPGDNGDLIIQDGILESPVSLLLDTVLTMQNPDKKLYADAKKLIKRLTREVLDVPYYYASVIMLRKQHSQ